MLWIGYFQFAVVVELGCLFEFGLFVYGKAEVDDFRFIVLLAKLSFRRLVRII